MSATETTRIWLDDHGVAWIADTNTKVIEVVLDQIAYGLTPDQIHADHPHLGKPQILAALAFYREHQEAMDEEIQRRYRRVEELRHEAGESPVRRKLRSLGHLG